MSETDSSNKSIHQDFEINYYSDDELQVNRKNKKKPTKNDQIYGIFNEVNSS